MRTLITLCLLLIWQTGAVQACSIFDPCKPAIRRVLPAKIKPAPTSRAARLADLERRLALVEAVLKEHTAVLGAQQHQLSRLAAPK